MTSGAQVVMQAVRAPPELRHMPAVRAPPRLRHSMSRLTTTDRAHLYPAFMCVCMDRQCPHVHHAGVDKAFMCDMWV